MLNPYLKYFFKPKFRKNFEKRGIANFFDFDPEFLNRELTAQEPAYWEKLGEKMALRLFREASRRVPAYKDFLKKNRVRPESVQTIQDFKRLPLIDKKNYFETYPLEKMCWDGRIEANLFLSSSSGSSGVPFFWPRGADLELETSILHEMFLKYFLGIGDRSTLVIIAFHMGLNIAGTITLDSVLRTAERPYPVTVVTPGMDENDIVRILQELSPKYEQTILAGYPPFIKDVIDAAVQKGIRFKKDGMKFLFATEGFSEAWRDYLLKKARTQNVFQGAVNIYGSSEAAILGHETPVSIFLRRLIQANKTFRDAFFQGREPVTLAQYNPALKYFEVIDGRLIFSSYAGLPLIRYDIKDSGGLVPFESVMKHIQDNCIAPEERGLNRNTFWKLPFVFVFGKNDSSIAFYFMKISPEHVKSAIEKGGLMDALTGKFVMQTKHRENQDEYWEVVFELLENQKPTIMLKKKILKSLIAALKKDVEFRALYKGIGRRAEPEIVLKPKGDRVYFPVAPKHKWSRKN